MNTIEYFTNEIQIVQSAKSNVLLLVGLFGASGGGKTVTAILMAIGFAPGQPIGVVDTEQKRSGMAADVAQKLALEKYGKRPEVLAAYLDAPFHPIKYVAALRKLQDAGCKAIVVDSMSHAWSGEGGYLDLKEIEVDRMAGDDFVKREKCSMAAAARVKPKTHSKLVDGLLHAKVPVILCFRSKEKTRMDKQQGKTIIVRDEMATPIQEEGLIYEMLISGEVKANQGGIGGYCRFRGPGCKHTHPEILKLLPEEGEQFSLSHAEALAKWCAAPTGPGNHSNGDPLKAAKAELWALLKPLRGTDKTWGSSEVWLVAKDLISDTETVNAMTLERLSEVLDKAKASVKELEEAPV